MTELVAHRGCAAVHPENTVRALRTSAREFPAVEFDVRRCGSGDLVVIHDATVDRVTDGTGAVAEHSLAELRELRVLGTDERIPTLSEAIGAVPPPTTLQVELKETGLGSDVLDALSGVGNPVRITSFLPAALREVGDVEGIDRGYLYRDDPDGLATALDLGCAILQPHWETCRDTDVVERAHDRGLAVIAWGAGEDPAAVAAAREAGVDGLTVDRPEL